MEIEELNGSEPVVSLDAQTPKMQALRAVLEEEAAKLENLDRISALTAPGAGARFEVIQPSEAAHLVLYCNQKNRNLVISKVEGYAHDMRIGDWKKTHQGIAFTPARKVGDGQHRLAAGASSGMPFEVLVVSDFDMDAIDAIDRTTRRTAAQALEMKGMTDAEAKTAVGRSTEEYIHQLNHGIRPRFSDMELARRIKLHEKELQDAVDAGRASVVNISDPTLTWKEAATAAAIMARCGWGSQDIQGYLDAVQRGIATFPNSPTLALARLITRAKIARSKDRLRPIQKTALTLKAAMMAKKREGVSRLIWDERREGLPDPTQTDGFTV